MHTVLIIVHVITCFLLIGVVLLQQGRGADMGAVFGGSSSTVFGSSGAGNFLTRLTAGFATVFMLTAGILTYMGAYQVTGTVFDQALPEPPPLEVPAQPAGSEAAPAAPAEAAPPAAGAPEAAPQAAEPEAAAPAAPHAESESAPPQQ